MAIKILMPALSPTMTQGKIAKWNVKVGDKIRIGDVIAEIETDKAVMEFETVDQGFMGPILIQEGDEVKVGEQIGWMLETADEEVPADSPVAIEAVKSEDIPAALEEKSEEVTVVKEASIQTVESSGSSGAKNSISTPAARARAKQLGITIEDIVNSGVTHKIREANVISYAEGAHAHKQVCKVPVQNKQLSGMQKVIATRMTEAKTTVPHFYAEICINFDKIYQTMQDCVAKKELKTTITHWLVKAVGYAMEQVPEMNVHLVGNEVRQFTSIDVAVAVSLENDGLITPIIPDVGSLKISELVTKMGDLVKRARAGKLLPHEFQGGSITISNMGMYGVNSFYPIMNLPQSSILGVGAAKDKLYLAEDGTVKTKKTASITISADHRVINGATAARFLQHLKSAIENPVLMIV